MTCKKLLTIVWLCCSVTLRDTLAQAPPANEAGNAPEAIEQSKTLKFVQNFEQESLKGVVGLTLSSDGRFLYASAYQSATLHTFSVDPQLGRLTLVDSLNTPNALRGVIDFRVSPDGKLGLATAFRSKAMTLFQRDLDTGKLTHSNSIDKHSDGKSTFQWPIRGVFSTDGKFAYVVDSGMTNSVLVMAKPSIVVLKVVDNKIEFVEAFRAPQGALANGRGIVAHPNGKHLFATASNGQSLVSLRRHAETGKLELIETKRSEPDKLSVLDGAMSVVMDPSGTFVYTLSGRFRGDGGVGVFAFDAEQEKLSLLEEHKSGSPGLENFQGGNQLAISPDGQRLYAVGTTQGTLSTFKRDPNSGKLTAIETVAFRPQWKGSAAAVEVSPDSRFVYVSGAELDPSITVFQVLP